MEPLSNKMMMYLKGLLQMKKFLIQSSSIGLYIIAAVQQTE